MTTHDATINSQAVQYSLARALFVTLPEHSCKLLPHPQGNYSLAICRECGFAVVGVTDEEAAKLLLTTMAAHGHGHKILPSYARAQFPPEVVDYLYQVYDPEGKVA